MKRIQITEHIVQFEQEGQQMPCCLTAYTGNDGLVLIDSGQSTRTEELEQGVQELGFQAPRFIINTHASLANVGGNGAFGTSPTILAHRGTRTMMQSPSHLLAELGADALPDVEIDGPVTLHRDEEEIRILPLSGSHSPTDLVVHFVHAGVACVGDIYGGRFFPFPTFGGHATEFSRVLTELRELLPSNTKLLYGHQSGVGSLQDFQEILDMMEETVPIVKQGVAAGKDRDTLIAEGLPERWEHLSRPGATAAGWIYVLYNDFTDQGFEQPDQLVPLYEGWKAGGGDGAVARIREEIAENAEIDPQFERAFLRFGYWLLRDKQSPSNAAKVFRLWAETFPASWNAYDSLAEAHVALGQTALAIEHYRKSLELNPENENGKTELAKLGMS